MSNLNEKRAVWALAHQDVLEVIRKLNKVRNLDELMLAVERMDAIAKHLRSSDIPSLLTGGNAALDIPMVASALPPMVTAMRQLGEVQAQDFAERFGIAPDAVAMVSYYLRQLGLVEKQGRGKKATLRLISEEIADGLVQSVWASVQPTAPADLAFLRGG